VAFVGGNALFQLVAFGLPAAGSVDTPIPIRIVFDAPADCSTVEVFYQGVRSRTDRVRRAETGETGTELGVRVTKTSGSVHGELNITSEHGESDRREVDGETCNEVVEALSLTAALALDPTARVSPAPIAPVPAPPAVVPPQPCPPPPPPPEPSGAFELGLHARATAAQVVTPDVSFGGSIGASVRPMASRPTGPTFGFAVAYLGNDLVAEPEAVMTHMSTASVSACPIRFRAGSVFFLSPCALVEGGFLEARGIEVSNPAWAVRMWWSVGLEVVVEAELGAGFSLELAPSLDVPLVKRRFTTGNPPEPAGETPAVSPGVGLGIGYHFQ
jgi:hypothetical protein